MPYEKKVDSMEVYNLIKKFHDEFKQFPNVGFLAGYFKVSKRVIYNKLILLEKSGRLERLTKEKYKTSYKLKPNN